MSTRKGLIFSVDYTIGLLIFILAAVIALKVIVNTFANTTYEDLDREAAHTTEFLMSTGYPEDWTNDTVFHIGLTTDKELNKTKIRRLYNMDPNLARRYLKTRNNFYVYFEDKDYGVLYLNQTCGYGDEGIRNNGTLWYNTVAYYWQQLGDDTYMLDIASQKYNASIYHEDASPGTVINDNVMNGSLYELMHDINKYDTLFMENPDFDSYIGNLTPGEVSRNLYEWVSEGNMLFIIGRVGITSIGGAAYPLDELGAGNISIVKEHEDYPFGTGDRMLMTNKHVIYDNNTQDFEIIGNYTNGFTGMATYRIGEGRVFYYADAEAYYKDGGYTNISELIDHTIERVALGYCEGLEIDMDYENLARKDRLLLWEDKIIRMGLYLWN